MVSKVKSNRLGGSAELKLRFPIRSDNYALTWPNELPYYTIHRHYSDGGEGVCVDDGQIFKI